MDVTDQLKAWGAAHAQARVAENAARQNRSNDLQREARSLRERADRLHREIYDSLDRPGDRAR